MLNYLYFMKNDPNALQRLSVLIGEPAISLLKKTHVALFGVGGVGSWCAEALVRSGVGCISLIDFDRIATSNINRQLPALPKTVGLSKVLVLAQRLRDISPEVQVQTFEHLYSNENRDLFDWDAYDFVIDAIDTVRHKTDLIAYAVEKGCTVFSSLGAAGKLDPTQVRLASIWKTKGCPLGKLVRGNLRKQGFQGDFKAVYSEEKPRQGYAVKELGETELEKTLLKPMVLGSAVQVTATFGMALTALVVQEVMNRISIGID